MNYEEILNAIVYLSDDGKWWIMNRCPYCHGKHYHKAGIALGLQYAPCDKEKTYKIMEKS